MKYEIILTWTETNPMDWRDPTSQSLTKIVIDKYPDIDSLESLFKILIEEFDIPNERVSEASNTVDYGFHPDKEWFERENRRYDEWNGTDNSIGLKQYIENKLSNQEDIVFSNENSEIEIPGILNFWNKIEIYSRS